MATINWASSVSGSWSTAADWAGGIVPGAGDTAVLHPTGKTSFTVDVTSPVTVGAVDITSTHATLRLDSALSAGALNLDHGLLLLENGSSLSGTLVVPASGGKLEAGYGSTTLTNLTVQGMFDPIKPNNVGSKKSTLTVSQGLTLTGASGTGTGTALFNQTVIFNNVASLDNATVELSKHVRGVTVANTPTLTLGAHFTLEEAGDPYSVGTITLTGGDALVNDGTIMGATDVYGSAAQYGKFTNNGVINGNFLTRFTSFTNNGTITIAGAFQSVTLATKGLQAAGASAAINIDGGLFGLVGSLTTAQLRSLYSAQHINVSGAYGFAVYGTLDNSGDTLSIGTGTAFGTADTPDLSYLYNPMLISGGTIIDHGGDGTYDVSGAQLESVSPTLSLFGGTLTSTTVTGATSLNVGTDLYLNNVTLSDIGTITSTNAGYGNLTLNGVTFTGLGASVQPVIDAKGMNYVGFTQAVDGLTVNNASIEVEASDGVTLDNTTFNITGDGEFVSGGSQALNLGANFIANISAGATETVGGYSQFGSTAIVDNGIFNVAGDIQFDFYNNVTDPTLSGDGTINLQGTSTTTAEADFGMSVSAGLSVAFGSGPGLVAFETPTDATSFKGTLAGFAAGDSLKFMGDNLSSAKFVGDTLVVKLSNGSTISLATGTAETGTLKISNAHGNGFVTFAGATAADWNVAAPVPSTTAAANHVTGTWLTEAAHPLAFHLHG